MANRATINQKPTPLLGGVKTAAEISVVALLVVALVIAAWAGVNPSNFAEHVYGWASSAFVIAVTSMMAIMMLLHPRKRIWQAAIVAESFAALLFLAVILAALADPGQAHNGSGNLLVTVFGEAPATLLHFPASAAVVLVLAVATWGYMDNLLGKSRPIWAIAISRVAPISYAVIVGFLVFALFSFAAALSSGPALF